MEYKGRIPILNISASLLLKCKLEVCCQAHERLWLKKHNKPQTTSTLHLVSLQKGAPKDTGTLFMCNQQESGQSTALQVAKQAFPRYTNQQ